MEADVVRKFKMATRGLHLDQETKKELMDWYADDHEDIKAIPQECFTLLVKQHCLSRGFITVRKIDEQT